MFWAGVAADGCWGSVVNGCPGSDEVPGAKPSCLSPRQDGVGAQDSRESWDLLCCQTAGNNNRGPAVGRPASQPIISRVLSAVVPDAAGAGCR